jgi:hypothetical protein
MNTLTANYLNESRDLAENYTLWQSSYDEENSNVNSTICSKPFNSRVPNWAVNVNHTRVTELLQISSPYHLELPLDCRILLKTGRSE